MSDIGIDIPFWLVVPLLGIVFWPVTLALELLTVVLAVLTSGRWRIVAAALAFLLAAELVAAAYLAIDQIRDAAASAAYERSVQATLSQPLLIDGLSLPASSEVRWTDPGHLHLQSVTLPVSASLLGVLVERLERNGQGDWVARLAGPQTIDGWPCQPEIVQLAPDGHLRQCTLESSRDWNGWSIPAETRVDVAETRLGMVFPTDAPVIARELGRPLPASGMLWINADGSLANVYFPADAPLVVCGVALWNTVTWRYADTTFGQGRDRPVIAVAGAVTQGQSLPEGTGVELRVADCALTK